MGSAVAAVERTYEQKTDPLVEVEGTGRGSVETVSALGTGDDR